MRRMARVASDADVGLETAARTWESLGITVTNQHGTLKASEQLFWEVARGLEGIESETKKAALAQELFGRGGANLLPMLNAGTDAIKDQMAEAKKLGIVYSKEAAKAGADFVDAQARMNAALKGATTIIGKDLMPTFTKLMNDFAGWASDEKNVQFLKDIAGGFALVGSSIKGVAKAYQWMVDFQAKQMAFWLMVPSNVELAWRTMTTNLRIMWTKFTNWLTDTWDATGGKIVAVAAKIKNKFDPYKKESPSMVDRWGAGLKQMESAYLASIARMSAARLTPAPAFTGGLGGGRPGGLGGTPAGASTVNNYYYNNSYTIPVSARGSIDDSRHRRRLARDILLEQQRTARSGI